MTERGSETLEFALVAPVLFLLVAGLIYGLLSVASRVSLHHAAATGVRYASIQQDGAYPTESDVEEKVESSTPFFGPDACTTTVTGDVDITLAVSCRMPGFPPLTARVTGRRE